LKAAESLAVGEEFVKEIRDRALGKTIMSFDHTVPWRT
jgi:hypothetical protein